MPEALFVGRERETDLYKKFLLRETPWVLIIIGLGGIGKTTLLHRLAGYTLAEPTLSQSWVVTLDFADEELRNDPLKLLEKLTNDTVSCCDLQQIDSDFKNTLQQNFDQLAQLSSERAQTGVSATEDLALREIRHQMRELAAEGFYAQIKTFKLERLVIMLDTCEWLSEPEGVEIGQWVLNELIPGMRIRLRQKSRLYAVVMASRVQPRLDVINAQDQRRLTLSMLGKAEVDQYLEYMGMEDPDLRQRVYEVTHGHALCVSIIGDFWKNRAGQAHPFTIADLPELQLQEFSEVALMRFTNERVLKQLKSPFKELTRYGVLLRSFDLPLLKSVFPELLPEAEALERFSQLIRYPYIESRGNYRYAFHELVREALAEETQKEDAERWKSYHKSALDYFTRVSPGSPDWYYHLLAYDERQGLLEWQQAIQGARNSGKREYTGALLQAALDKALRLSPAARAEIVYEQGRFNYYGTQWEEALKSYEEALSSFQEVGDYAGQARVLHAQGDVQRARAKENEALESYEKALAFFQQTGDQFAEAKCRQAIGDVQRLRNDHDAALRSYEQALDLFQRIGNQAEQAKVLEAIGDVQRFRNDHDAALRNYEQALTLYQEEKDRLKRAKVLKTIGDLQRSRMDNDAAQESYEQALALFGELKEPAEEAGVRRAIEEMQRSILVPYVTEEGDQQASYMDPPTLAVPHDSPALALLLQESDAPGMALNGPFGRVILGSTAVTIGRRPGNQVVVKDPRVSSYHVEIRSSGQGYVLTDLGSTNGTFVNENRVVSNTPYTLNPGDRIRVGDISFTYEVNTFAQSAPPPYSGANQESTPAYEPTYAPGAVGVDPHYEANTSTPYAPPQYSGYGTPGRHNTYEANTPTPYTPSPTFTDPYTSPAYSYPSPPLYPSYSPIPPPQPQRRARGAITAFMALVLLVIIGSSGLIYYTQVFYPAQLKAHAVASATALASDHATGTVQAQATATASLIASNPNPYLPGSGTVALYDPLNDNNRGYHWDSVTNSSGTCGFTGQAYDVSTPRNNFFFFCTAEATNFSNFAFEAQMQILKGDCGGLIFRADANNGKLYLFDVCQDGSYSLYLYRNFSGTTAKTLGSGSSAAITTGLNQTNVLAVVAQGTALDLYVNNQKIDSVSDGTYSHGQIALAADASNDPTEVAFNNARVWTL
jgi:pSer/pThr/pTyr-binding forkhead associated (FHA) protein/tetratricopeptide (TPR) repeat protein